MAWVDGQWVGWTAADLASLEQAIASGKKEVRFQDRTEVFRDSKELFALRDAIQQYIFKQGGGTRVRQHRVIPGDGF